MVRLECSGPCAVPVTSGSICMEKHVPLKKISMHENDKKKNTRRQWVRGKGNIKNGEQKEWVGCWLENTKYSVRLWCGATLWPRNKDVSMWSQLEECEKDLLITEAVASSYPLNGQDCRHESCHVPPSLGPRVLLSHSAKKLKKKQKQKTLRHSGRISVFIFFLPKEQKKTSFYPLMPHKAGQ